MTEKATSVIPPFYVLHDFLPTETIAALLAHARKNISDFEPTVLRAGNVDTSIRVSTTLTSLEPFRKDLEQKTLATVPKLISELRVTPFKPCGVEIELVASGDGAFYKPHIDTFTGKEKDTLKQRLISLVYYFNREPKAYSGGELRLLSYGSSESEGSFVDIEPQKNSLVAFPSWVFHEVRPVTCPSRKFLDSRFSINMWVLRNRPDPIK